MSAVIKSLGVFALVCCLVACDASEGASDAGDASASGQSRTGSQEGTDATATPSVDREADVASASDPVSESDAVLADDVMLEDDVNDETVPTGPAETMMSVQLINAASNAPYAGVAVAVGDEAVTTDSSGIASVMVAAGPYHVTLEASDARTHNLYGVADESDFTQISFMSPDTITQQVFGSMGIVDDPTRGTLVVGLDQPNLAPAVGASAAIDVASDPAFIFAGFFPQTGTTITAGGQSFVTFPNVEAGAVQVSASLPGGACLPFPALSGDPQVQVHPGEVSVVAFICE